MCVDQDSVVYCLPASAVAFAAPGCNHDGYQVEHAGYARQSPEEWGDAASVAMLQLAAGMSGFVGHDQVSRVYKRSDHTDPGPAFPWSYYMSLVRGDARAEREHDERVSEIRLLREDLGRIREDLSAQRDVLDDCPRH